MSLLLENGHAEARFYPLGMVWDEARIVVARKNAELASGAALLQMVGASLVSKKGGSSLKKVLKELTSG